MAVNIRINFTVAGSKYDRIAREEQRRRAQAEKKRQEEAARQRQLEAERQAREKQEAYQRQLEQDRQRQLQSVPDTPTMPQPLPSGLETEVDDELLRKFRERIEQYQKKQ